MDLDLVACCHNLGFVDPGHFVEARSRLGAFAPDRWDHLDGLVETYPLGRSFRRPPFQLPKVSTKCLSVDYIIRRLYNSHLYRTLL